jgi:uncharacterized LabA/DUF88 family protein
MSRRVALLIDGGHLRALVRKAGKKYNPDYIEKVALGCLEPGEEFFRIFYYDAPPFSGTVKLPISGAAQVHAPNDDWIKILASKELFAVRLGVLKFRGFKPKTTPLKATPLTDDDFAPDFEQKGVDMRIGLDIALFAETRAVERIILITNDTDCIPAMKYGRRAGLQLEHSAFKCMHSLRCAGSLRIRLAGLWRGRS